MLRMVLPWILLSAPGTLAASQNDLDFVLVHGALFTGAGWSKVQKHLENEGYSSLAVDLPGRNGDSTPASEIKLETAARALCSHLEAVSRPVTLVGHSQGGAVITQALAYCASKISALVYVAAVVPLNGELPFDRLSASDHEAFDRCATYDPENKIFRVNRSGPLHEEFMGDLSRGEAAYWTGLMVDEPSEIGNSRLIYPEREFQRIPKFYVETLQDRIISISTQRNIQEDVRFAKIYTLDASHSPFLSQPRSMAEILKQIKKISAL